MPSQLTITAKTGPAVQNTAAILTDLTNINVDLTRRIVQVFQNTPMGPAIKEYDLVGVTTFTCAISGSNYTFVIS